MDDLECLRQALGFDQWSRYGFSYGGPVAQGYALAYPARVRRLVLANTLYGAEMWALNHANIHRVLEHQYPEVWDQIEALRSRGVRSSDPAMQKLFAAHRRLVRWYNPEHAGRLQTEPRSRHDDL